LFNLTGDDEMINRSKILEDLISFSRPIDTILVELNQLPWDYDGSPITLRSIHVTGVLKRFSAGQLTAQEIENWANLIENREDVDYEDINHDELESAIYRLANPILEGELNLEVSSEILEEINRR
jgi:hypothetical protein